MANTEPIKVFYSQAQKQLCAFHLVGDLLIPPCPTLLAPETILCSDDVTKSAL